MMNPKATTTIQVGPVSFRVELHKATAPEGGVELDSLCEHGLRPTMQVACPQGCVKGSWNGWPQRGYPKGGPYLLVLSKRELDEAEEGAHVHEALRVERVVSLYALTAHHGLTEPCFVLPAKDAVGVETVAYATVRRLLGGGSVALARYTWRGLSHRYALLADVRRRLLVAYRLTDLRDVPRGIELPDVPSEALDAMGAMLRLVVSDDAHYPKEPDPIRAVLEARAQAAARAAMRRPPEGVATDGV